MHVQRKYSACGVGQTDRHKRPAHTALHSPISTPASGSSAGNAAAPLASHSTNTVRVGPRLCLDPVPVPLPALIRSTAARQLRYSCTECAAG